MHSQTLPEMLQIATWLCSKGKKNLQNLKIKKKMYSVSFQCPMGSLFNGLTEELFREKYVICLIFLLLIKSPRCREVTC